MLQRSYGTMLKCLRGEKEGNEFIVVGNTRISLVLYQYGLFCC